MKITIPYLKPTVVGRTVTVTYADRIFDAEDRPNQPGFISRRQVTPIREIVPAQFTALDYDFKIAKRSLAVGASAFVIALAAVSVPAIILAGLYDVAIKSFRELRSIFSVTGDTLRVTLNAVVNPK